MDTKEVKELYNSDKLVSGSFNFLGVFNEKCYWSWDYYGDHYSTIHHITCTDTDGKVLNSFDLKSFSDNFVIDKNNEPVFLVSRSVEEFDWALVYKFVDSEFNDITDDLMESAEHGTSKPMDIDHFYRVGDKLYVRADKEYFLDTEAGKLTEPPYDIYEKMSYSNVDYDSNIGKYYVVDNKIYDTDTGDMLAKVHKDYKDVEFYYTYFGGDSNIILNDEDDYWYKVKLPSDGSEPDWTKAEKLGYESGSGEIAQIDDTYYLYSDDYGIFLRTYEKGEEEEYDIIRNK